MRRWELFTGHANGFWRKKLACNVSQPNLCPGSRELTRSSRSFWRNTKCLSYPTHRTPLIWHPVSSSYFQKWKLKLKGCRFNNAEKIRPNLRECLTLWQIRTSRKRSRNGGEGGTGVYIWEGTISRVMAADRPYAEFNDFYSVSPEYFEYHLVFF
jgi:hypothetical protein